MKTTKNDILIFFIISFSIRKFPKIYVMKNHFTLLTGMYSLSFSKIVAEIDESESMVTFFAIASAPFFRKIIADKFDLSPPLYLISFFRNALRNLSFADLLKSAKNLSFESKSIIF